MENDAWIEGLSAGREETVLALRSRLNQGLATAFANRADVDEADLEDYVQEAVMRILDGLDAFRGESRFTTWAMAIAVRTGLTALRRRRWRNKPIDDLLNDMTAPIAADGDGIESASRNEVFAALRRSIDEALTPHQRRVVLAELEGIPQVVLAEQLGTTAGSIYKMSHDARKKLKSSLISLGFDSDTVLQSLRRYK